MAARSFSSTASTPEGLARPLSAARGDVSSPTGGLVFLAGPLAQDLERVAEQVRTAWRNVPACIVPSTGVITERGEIEGVAGASGVLWNGGRVATFCLGELDSPEAFRRQVEEIGASGTAEGAVSSGRWNTVLLFVEADAGWQALEDGAIASPSGCLLGGGTVGGAPVVVTAEGAILRGKGAGLIIGDVAPPLVEAATACRVIGSFRRIEAAEDGLLLRMGDKTALEALSSVVPEAAPRSGGPPPRILLALSETADPPFDAVRPQLILRSIQGVDPARGGLLIGSMARPGAFAAFAVQEASVGRASLEATARTVAQNALGAAPRFALYLGCAERGQNLYGAGDVESRVLRQRFGDLPMAGMRASFELLPWNHSGARATELAGVLALFRSPS